MSHPRALILGSSAVIAILFIPAFRAMAASNAPPNTTAAFLQHAASGQQQEIDLGQLAVQKAGSEDVKQFGARMVADHQKAQQEVQQLASAGGIRLESSPTASHQQMKTELTKVSGKEFDRAYMTVMLREHAKEMKALQQHALVEKNDVVRAWAAGAVPVVKEHLVKANTIASSLGISAEHHTK